ncbi:MAG: hypothetical protein M1828_005864 [Chrysothrix sp. TS-e1954]|nr:MAG: hypothetical protein M1828_005864 [Chrysothrix sp. TS-e1954]
MTTSAVPKTMIEAHVSPETTVSLIHDVPVPRITSPTHILIRVVVCGCNPKDWKMPAGALTTIHATPNSGDDLAGTVVAVGSSVHEFRVGDRVAALHEPGAPHGAFAEYALVNDSACIKLADHVSFEEAVTLPMVGFMACLGLFGMLKITPGLWMPAREEMPFVIYGAASGVGAMAVKLAMLAEVHPLICVAGEGVEFVEGLIDRSKGDTIVNYKNGDEAVVRGMKEALKGRKLEYAFDCITAHSSYINLSQVLDHQTGKISIVLPPARPEIPGTIEQTCTMAGSLWKDPTTVRSDIGNLGLTKGGPDFAAAYGRTMGRMLADGRLKPHQHVVVEGGLGALEGCLQKIKRGEANATRKFVLRVRETPALRERS